MNETSAVVEPLKTTVGWDADSWLPRAVKHLASGRRVLSDYELGQLCILGEVEDLPLSHGVAHAYSCTAHLLCTERMRMSYLRMLTVWYYGVDTKKSGPYTLVWDDRLSDERLQKGYDRLCRRLVEAYEEEFPAAILPSGQSSFKWMGHYPLFSNFLAFAREGKDGEWVLFLLNRGEKEIRGLDFGVAQSGEYEVVVDTEELQYMGGHEEEQAAFSTKPLGVNGYEHCLFIDMPPASALVLKLRA